MSQRGLRRHAAWVHWVLINMATIPIISIPKEFFERFSDTSFGAFTLRKVAPNLREWMVLESGVEQFAIGYLEDAADHILVQFGLPVSRAGIPAWNRFQRLLIASGGRRMSKLQVIENYFWFQFVRPSAVKIGAIAASIGCDVESLSPEELTGFVCKGRNRVAFEFGDVVFPRPDRAVAYLALTFESSIYKARVLQCQQLALDFGSAFSNEKSP